MPSNNQWSDLIKTGNKKLSQDDSAKIAVVLQSEDTSKVVDSLYIMISDFSSNKIITLHPSFETLSK